MTNRAILFLTCGFIAIITLFSVGAPDFWWHVQAGKLFWTEGWITTEPFAHTRIGEPYLATQSWLADIILFLFFSTASAAGIITLRILIAIGIALLLLRIDTKKLYPNTFLVCLLAIALLPSMKDRPQLFTFLLFAASFFAVLQRKFIVLSICQLLWANLHGGASLVAFGLLGAGFFDSLYTNKKIDLHYVYTGIAMVIAFLATPNFLHNAEYVRLLFTDETKQFIKEWAAAEPSSYFRETGLFWILAIGSLYWSRYKMIFSVTILVIFGSLSLSASRHIPLFLITAIGVTILQLSIQEHWPQKNRLIPGAMIVVLLVMYLPHRNALSTLDQLKLSTYEPYASAFDFIEDNDLQGNMFNTYDIGGYLLFRGYPDRKVFVDGRNVDYGYDFLSTTFNAAQDGYVWSQLEEEYGLTYAIIEHVFLKDEYPYSHHLDIRTDWHLVYLDEYAAVYAKEIPEHLSLIEQYSYTLLTPKNFYEMTVFQNVEQNEATLLEKELLLQAQQAPKSSTALLLLAQLYVASGLQEEAQAALEEAKKRQPKRPAVDVLMKEYTK